MVKKPRSGQIGDGGGAAAVVALLEDYGYQSAEEVFYAAQLLGPELADLLGETAISLQNKLLPAIAMFPQARLDELAALPCALGVPPEGPPVPIPAPEPVVAPLKIRGVNHVPQLPPIRNQGTRGTCVAYASAAVVEHRMTLSGAYQDLSEQFLYWNCKQNDGSPSKPGTWVRTAFPLIQRDGICLESTWAYVQTGCTTEGCGPPPPGAIVQALTFRQKVKAVPPNSVQDLKATLQAGFCIAFSVPVYRSWYYSPVVRDTGRILMPLPNDILEGGHAMTLVGYADSEGPGLGGGEFILRNSWGTNWGAKSAYGAGYGSIPYAYLARYGWEAYTLR